MPKAEVGSTKWVANKMRRKGLQKLKWYCQVCERQMPDDNGWKLHTQSESHVRRMLAVGEDPRKATEEFSREFLRHFIQLLKTGHGEKSVQINRFYQEVIAQKDHIHMNSTKWPNLTEFAKHLGREGICRVEETDKGLHVAWIDNSPEALRRQEELRRKDVQDRGNEEVEQMMIREQIKRAQQAEALRGGPGAAKSAEDDEEGHMLKREEGEKIKLSFGAKPAAHTPKAGEPITSGEKSASPAGESGQETKPTPAPEKPAAGGISLKMTAKPQTKNVFAAAKKNALSGSAPKKNAFEQPKKMSEAERIMREDMEQQKKRGRDGGSAAPFGKKQKTDR
ncbi:zinc finger protein RTS2 [Plectosphaerella plurivora]|uniref:Zinc finger protein RTS2 n=1 Tax=Plectosphaerella plurivora TaxID=936078 RepID=A0A9P9A7X7_9PEZI|nr:zinc finger protein RTS2 [Plectosphaerella plurivora]